MKRRTEGEDEEGELGEARRRLERAKPKTDLLPVDQELQKHPNEYRAVFYDLNLKKIS